ncbi:type II toxin-antitoxin system ParD family antitoxin [Flagellatimonas centrodinii]|uniref:type II toxin-antitoxin system ParD family antitoxin n=1 Tax=Flagellatimonas centrodinii TaxID=2806210 RepID=UPI001FED3C34|nr:type II toxin-antitoxin system ParD family antitoxin [Flagellatimonas centrodinii]
MTTVRKTITLTDQQGAWVKARIANGDFTNDSEYIRDLIRRDQQSKAEVESIRTALIAGENSGLSDKKPGQILQAVIKRKRKRGAL